MNRGEQAIGIAEKMYDSRRTVLQLYGHERFKKETATYQQYIKAAMVKHGCNELQAVTQIIRLLLDKGFDGMPVAWTLAAYVEMIEPLPEEP